MASGEGEIFYEKGPPLFSEFRDEPDEHGVNGGLFMMFGKIAARLESKGHYIDCSCRGLTDAGFGIVTLRDR